MKEKLFKLLICFLFAVGLIGSKDVKSQTSGTAGTMAFSAIYVSHTGQYSTLNNGGKNHYTVIWVQTASGAFVKTLYRDQLAPGKDVWEHCQVWVAAANTLPYGSVVDAVTSATLTSYTAPVTTTWAGTDTTNPSPFKLLPDGQYRLYVETAWDATYIMGAGRDTASFPFTKGPASFTSLPYTNGASILNTVSITWTPAAQNTIAITNINPVTYAAGAAVSIPFTKTGTATVYANNVWTAQLSDASGSFASPVSIGTLATITSGTIAATIPLGTPAGTGYRIRVMGTAPGTVSANFVANITITNGISPTVTAAGSATVDAPFNATFTDDATWRAAVTAVKIGGTTLTAGYTITAGQIAFTPSASVPANLLQTSGSLSIKVIATGYNDVNLTQALGAGVAAKLAVKTQPAAPATSGAVLSTQPAIYVQDQYGNSTTSTASVIATVGTGVWVIGGTTTIAATAGTATFTNLTATSVSSVAATITFTSTGLTSVSSNAFNVSPPLTGGTVTVGTGGTYTSFTKAGGLFSAINLGGLSGSVVANITSDITNEDGTNALNQWAETGGSGYTLTIQPSGGAARIISGTVVGGPLLNFNGADRVTIDGLNTGSNALTISNLDTATTVGSSTIKFINDASNNTITNCTVLGSSRTIIPALPLLSPGGTIFLSTGVTTGNDYITISNCKIGPAGTILPSKGIASYGSIGSSVANSNITVTNCEIYDFSLPTSCAGIYAFTGNTDWTITNNKVYQTASRSYTVAGTMFGIYFNSQTVGSNIQITGNTIGYASNAGTGTFTLVGSVTNGAGAFNGIYFAGAATASSACNINNNIISDFSMTVTTGAFIGINSTTLTGTNTVNINSNQIKNIVHEGTTGAVTGIATGSGFVLNCNSNIIDGITKTALTTSGAIYGIKYNNPTTITLNNNIVRNLAYNSTAGTGAIYAMYSQANSYIPTANITNNSFYNINTLSTGLQTIIGYADLFSVANTTSLKNVQNNTIYNITAPAAGLATIYGIRIASGTSDISGNSIYTLSGGTNIYGIALASTGVNNVYKNKMYDLSTGIATTLVYGIYSSAGSTNTFHNNIIGDLRTTAANLAMPLVGIYINGGTTTNVYYNTVNLNATSTGALFGSAAVYATNAQNVTLRNNIFVNTSTAAGATFTAAYWRSGAANLSKYGSLSDNNLFYAGTPGAANLLMYDGTNSYQTLAAYKTAMVNRDAASVTENPTWVSTTGSAATFLHINTTTPTLIESGAAPIATFTTDYDGDTRNATTPDIGADEFAGAAPTACSGTPAAATIIGSSVCPGSGATLSLSSSYLNTGITYQWASSATSGGTQTSLGTAKTQLTGNLSATTYYICTITCANGGAFVATPEKTITVSAIPSTPVVTSTDNCGNSVLSTTATGTLLWNNSVTTSTNTVTTGGTYSVTQTIGGCASAAGTVVAAPVAVPATPVVTVVNNCGSSVLSTPAGILLWSNAATTSSITVTTPGAITVTNTANGCTSLAGSGTAAPLAMPATPVVTVVDSCGKSVLSTTATGTLLWSNGATTSSIIIPTGAAGTFSVKTTAAGCSSIGYGTAAPKDIPAAPVVTVVNNCGNSVLTTGAAGTLLWSNSATTPSITVTIAGTSTVKTTVSGCVSALGSGTAAPFIPTAVTISENSGVLTSTATTGNVWHEVTLGVIAGATAHTFTPTANGYYFTVVTDGNNCSVNSDTIHLTTIGIETNSLNENVKIYPNPTSEIINIAFNQLNGKCKLMVENVLGVVIYQEQLEQTSGLIKSIDLSKYANGFYFVNIQAQNNELRYKVILNK